MAKSKKTNSIELTKEKYADALLLDVNELSQQVTSLTEQYKQIDIELTLKKVELKKLIETYSMLFNIGTYEERKQLHPKLNKLELLLHQINQHV